MRRFALPLACALILAMPAAGRAHEGLPDVAAVQAGPYVVTVLNDSPTLATGRNAVTVQAPDLPAGYTVALTFTGPSGEVVAVPLQPVWVLDGAGPGHDAAEHGAGGGRGGTGQTGSGAGHAAAGQAAMGPGAGATEHAAPELGAGATEYGVGPSAATMDHAAMGHGLSGPMAGGSVPGGRAGEPGMADSDPQSLPGEPLMGGSAPAGAAGAQPVGDEGAGAGYLARGTASLGTAGLWQARLVVAGPGQERYAAQTIVEVRPGGPNRLYLAGTGSVIGGFLLFGIVQRRRQASSAGKAR